MLKNFILKNPFQLFLSILMPFLLSSVLVIFVQSSFLTKNFEKFALSMVYNQQKTDLQNTSRNVSVMERTANSLATTAFFDNTITDLLYSDVDSDKYTTYKDKLLSYKNIYPFLQSIYIYNGHNIYAYPGLRFVYDRSNFMDSGIFTTLDDIYHIKSHSMVLRKIPNAISELEDAEAKQFIYVYSYLFFDSQVQSGKVSEAIILNISEESLRESISTSGQSGHNRTFIVDHDGQLLSDDSLHPISTNISNTNYIQAINASKEKAGYLRMDVDGVDSFVTYTATDVFDWKLVSITPYPYIVQDINKMKHNTYLFVLIFILCSFILSFYFSRRLYLPIKLVIQNYNILESEKKNDYYYKKQNFLRKMVNTEGLHSVEGIQKQFNKYNIMLEPKDSFLMVLIKLDHFAEFNANFNLTDRGLLKYGLNNIVSEIFSKVYKHECIDIEEDQILVLINYSLPGLPSKNEQLVALIIEIQENAQKFLNLSISFTSSEAFETLHELNHQYLKTLDLSYYRLIFGYKSLIFQENLNIKFDENYKYPQELDKKMTDSLIQGQHIEAEKALSDIIQNASQYSFTILNSVLIRLLLSIRSAIEVLEANHSLKVNFNLNIYLAKLQKIETLEKIQTDFYSLFESLSIELESKKDNKYIKLLEDVTSIIDKDFANPALSLDTIAEKVNLSASYLGKLFKKHRLISMTDYINNVRLVNAGEMIANTEETINDIMEKSGFLSRSHFFTLFKKVYGVTPNQYRSNAKNNNKNNPSQ
ncbi:AraC family transcriptional regulator [Paenibacillus psychroresistens]|uniref:AraC family transcriptional regulator n=1 Tax=Paenibacillus psychroresistens TaxID=1778678 RepID=A0A6B8RTX1_9BACL|nr:AraC family transcriptional regulator [Paenibacillus psychroresistens]QGQ98756.1 AraC family transcriptional regulator [Paenibacillus psychroresistens]